MNKKVVGAICAISTLFVFNSGAVTFAENLTQFSIDVSDAALQLTVPPTASIELNPTSSNAVFGTTNVTVSVATNNMNGYRLSMSVPTTDLVHISLANTVIPTLSNPAPETTFPVNAWGYKVVDNDYLPVLATNAPASWSSEQPTNGTDHILTLAAKVDGAKPSGTYETTLNFNVVTNPNTFKDTVVFNGNGATSGSMVNQFIFQGEATKLDTNAYTKTGYLFNGWNTKANGLGKGYSDEDSYTTTISSASKTITLYAQWICDSNVNTCTGVPSADGSSGNFRGKTIQDAYEMAYVTNPGLFPDGGGTKHGLYVPEKNPDTGAYTGNYFEATSAADYEGIPANDLRFAIQDIALEIDGVKVCDYATVIGSEAYVLDLRDFTSYHIIKAADGRCWTTDNLALDISKASVRANMNPDNTNADEASLISLASGNRANGAQYANGSVSNGDGSSNSRAFVYTGRINTVFTYDNIARDRVTKDGIYYNVCAASAGSYCYGNGVSSDGSPPDKPNTDIDVDYDVCPSGWRMPTGSGSGEYSKLISAYGNNTVNLRSALYVQPAGNYHHGGYQHDSYTFFWSSTYNGPASLYALGIGGSSSPSINGRSRDYRHFVRCINK